MIVFKEMLLSGVLASGLLALGSAATAQEQTKRLLEPANGVEATVNIGRAIVVASDAKRTSTRSAGRVLVEPFYLRTSRNLPPKYTVQAGATLIADKDGWWCTEVHNYYQGSTLGRANYAPMCFRDRDNNGTFDQRRIGRGLVKRNIEPGLAWAQQDALADWRRTGLHRALIYRGMDGNNLLMDLITYVNASTKSPLTSKRISVPMSQSGSAIIVEGVRIHVRRATPRRLEYTIVGGTL